MALRTFTFNLSDIEFLLSQIDFRPLFTKDANGVLVAVINWSGDTAIYDSTGSLIVDPTQGGTHVPTPAEISANLAAYGSSYSGYVDIAGLRDVSGAYNNLLPGQQYWGATNQPFARQANADFNHYLKQVLGAVSTEITSSTVASDGPVTAHSATVAPGVTVTYNTFDHSVVATTTTTTDGHHLVVSTNALTQTLTVQTMVSDAAGSHPAGDAMTTPLPPSTYLSGGELDPLWHPGLAAKVAAAQTVGTTTGLDMASYNPGKSVVDYTPRMISETITTGGHVTYDANGHYLSGDGVVLMHDSAGHVVYYSGQTSAELAAFQYDSNKVVDTRGLVLGAAIVDTSVPLQPGQPDGSGGVGPNGDSNLYSGAGYGTLATVGQHDKQNTDANNITGFGNHEYFYGNIASIGGNAPNNQFLALFGQFFDHGLDFIGKAATDSAGHTVNITIPLAVNDPLYGVIGNDGQPTTTITITRATVDNTWLKDTAGNVLDGHDLAHSVVDGNGAAVLDVNGLALSRAGVDGVWGTADDVKTLGGPTQNSVVGAVLAPQNPTYLNHSSPYIDQSQTYGSVSDTTQILREWVEDPNNPGHYIPGTKLLDGHQTVSYTNAFGAPTTATLPTLNELRASITATDRTSLTWEDVTDALRHRDAQGHVGYYDATGKEVAYLDSQTVSGGTVIGGQAHWVDPTNTSQVDLTGLITHSSAEPLLIDINPHVDAAHLTSALALDAIATLNASLTGFGSLAIVGGDVTLTINANVPGAGTYTGVAALSPWVNFADFSITNTLFNAPGAPAITPAVHAAVGEVLMDSIGDHYVAGDGRANENFGLTAIHQVWHEEHGFQVQNVEATIASLDAQATAADALKGTALDVGHTTVHNWETAVKATGQAIRDSFVASVVDGAGHHFEATGGVLARDTSGNFYAASTNLAAAQADVVHQFAGYVLVDNTVEANIQSGVVTNGISATGNYTDANGFISWNQNDIFNAAKVTVEMEYQHVAVDQFSRAVSPNIQEFAGVSTARNAAISLEYGEAAYRFGHSTLRETLDTMDPAGGVTGKIMSYALEEAFLNPAKFATVGAGAVVQGAARQLMNEVDQIVTPSLNEGLLAQPLDLGAINIARGRDVGLPTLNAFKAAAGIGQVYASWAAFQQNMVHPERIADFVAAYSFDGDLQKANTIVDLANLQAGQTLADSEAAIATANGWDQVYAHNFMTNVGAGDPADGVNHIDLWIGGLAETHVAGGILGETFDAIFVNQIENLMDGDRFYYLQRLVNQSFGNEIQNEQFKDIVERNTGARDLNGNVFTYADVYYDDAKAAKVATGDLANPAASGDLFAGSKSDGSWIKVFDGATGLWSTDAAKTVFDSHTVRAGAIYDLWGQQVTDLFDANHVKVFDRATMTWSDPTLADGSKPLYYDANTNANGVASLHPASFVYLGADQHKYGAILDAHAHDTNGLTVDDGLGSLGATGVGIYSEDGTTTALNGAIGKHNVTLTYGDDTTPGAPVISFSQSYVYDTRPDGTTVNKDGSIDTGGNSAEVLVGTPYDDFLQMGIGDDTAYGGKGNDIIYGGNANAGHNTIYGGDGNDYLVGGDAPDLIDGGNGDDWILGESSGSSVNGVDQLIGGTGNDHIFGGIGIDKIFGGTGDDYIYGGTDTDPTVFGGDGNDYMNGGSGVDVMNGDNGDDIMDGGPGVDQLFGGSGDDILRPGDIADVAGNGGGGDVLVGGDSVTLPNGTSTDDGFDFADYSQQTTTNGLVGDLANQAAVGQLPSDKTPLPPGVPVATSTGDVWFEMEGIIGTKNADHLFGDSPADPSATPVSHGNNWLIGGSGSDVFVGRGGNDVIVGGSIRLDSVDGTYFSPSNPGDAYHAANDYSVNAEGASHRIYDDATLQHNGLLDAATTAAAADGFTGVSFDKHFTTLLQSRAYKDYVLGDNGTDGTNNIAAYTGAVTDYDIKSVAFTDAHGTVISALLVHDHRPVGQTGLLADGITPGDGTDLLIGIQALEFNYNETTGTGTVISLAAPVFQSPPTFSLNENTTVVGTVTTLAALPVTYSIVTGAGAGLDAALFTVDATTGVLSFVNAPNFEMPNAAGGGNLYDVVVRASDATGFAMQDIKVSVINVNEAATGSLTLGSYTTAGNAVTLHAASTLADPDVPAGLTLSYQWQSSVDGVTWTNIAGQTTANLSTTVAQANHFVRVEAMYTDPFGLNTVVSSQDALIGTTGNNTLNGSSGSDVIFGLGGNDTLNGGGGDDTFVFSGTSGMARVDGGAGFDTILANTDNTVIGLTTVANVEAITGGGHANVTISASGTLDLSAVTLTGIAAINGGFGNDTITGSAGDDTINGGFGNDVLYGGAGNDTIDGSVGNDTLYGGAGNDTFLVGVLSGTDTIFGGTGIDTIQATVNNAAIGLGPSFSLAVNGVETISAGGHTGLAIVGTNGADTYDFSGMTLTGITRIDGGGGNDTITGTAGNDTIVGGAGQDTLRGGGGANTFRYTSVSESTGNTFDKLLDFNPAVDKIQLPGADKWSAGTYGEHLGGTLNATNVNANLASIFSAAMLPANSAEFFAPSSGTLAGNVFLIVDGNGVAGYQAGQDWVFEVAGLPPGVTGTANFIV